jgi:outer membrane protein assembly factor BamB
VETLFSVEQKNRLTMEVDMKSDDLIFVGIKGSVIALTRAGGEVVWEIHLKGMGFVHLVRDGDHLYAATKGEIFCLDAATGAGVWNNPLKGYGYGLASIAARNGSDDGGAGLLAAEARAREEADASAAATTVQ